MAFGKSDEEKAADRAAKLAADEAHEAERAAQAYAASPAGQAAAAKARGDGFFQVEIDINRLVGTSALGSSRGRLSGAGGRPDLLGQIEDVGWRLEHVGYVFIETGSTSTNRALSTGQGTVTRGVVRGIYLFRNVDPV
jgi:hypothetical protein